MFVSGSYSMPASRLSPFFSQSQRNVFGIICISPTAPAFETAFETKPLSVLITE